MDDDDECGEYYSCEGDSHLSIFPKKGNSDEFIKSSVEVIVPIPKSEEKSVTFLYTLYSTSHGDFTSSDDDRFYPIEDVPERIFDINPLFDEVLEDIESKDSYVSNLDEQALLVTPLSDANKDF
ncbi:hypothetical protein Tco_0844528 [Tanacetum coccineum]